MNIYQECSCSYNIFVIVVISCTCCISHVIMETVSYTKLLLEDFSLHYWPLTPSVTRTLEKGWKHLYLLLTLDFIWSHLMITPLNVAFWRAVWTHSNLYLDVTLCKGDLVLANTIAISMTSLLPHTVAHSTRPSFINAQSQQPAP